MARWSAKLPTASVIASWTLDELPDPPAFWRAVTATAAHHLAAPDTAAQERIVGAVAVAIENYVRDAEDEATAEPVARTKKRVAELRRSALAFVQALGAPRAEGATQAESLIEEMAGDSMPSFGALFATVNAFVVACNRALARLDELAGERHFAPGWAWDRFIAALADAFEQATGRPATAAKDLSMVRASRFVLFAHAIQVLLPGRLWRHQVVTAKGKAPPEPSAAFNYAVAEALAVRRGRAAQKPQARHTGAKSRAQTKK
jgi:hypothetical protein